uniref:Uncharacterized protein n=1 Tax=Arundo donax TaxID=35708 RepID=A0A0A9BTF5_ARUDO
MPLSISCYYRGVICALGPSCSYSESRVASLGICLHSLGIRFFFS